MSWKEQLAQAQADLTAKENALPSNIDAENSAMKQILGADAFSNLPEDDVPAPARPTVPMNPNRKPKSVLHNNEEKKVTKMTEEIKQEVEAPVEASEELEQDDMFDPLKYLGTIPGAPSAQQVEQWKAHYGEVQFVPLEENSAFIFRPLSYPEWKGDILIKPELVKDESMLADYIRMRCVLWPQLTPEVTARLKAGLPDLMYKMIMEYSYFIQPEKAMAVTVRL